MVSVTQVGIMMFLFCLTLCKKLTSHVTTKKSILITGCSSGIGLCLAKGLQNHGYRIFATVRKDRDLAPLQSAGLACFQLDLADSRSIQNAVRRVLLETDHKLYGLINNGAYQQPGAVEDLQTDVLRAQFETNLFGTHELTRRVLPIMHQQGEGRIIQISSVLGLVTLPYRGAYNASKFALEGLSDTLRLELQGSGIFVSLIEPGPITSQIRKNAYEMFVKHIDREHSVHRDTYSRMEKRFTRPGKKAPFTLPPEAVLKRTLVVLSHPSPAARYYVTFPTYLFATLKRLLPISWLDKFLLAISRSENK